MTARLARLALLLGVIALLGACAHAPRRPASTGSVVPRPDDAALLRMPDAVPRTEPKSPYGNPSSYVVFGHRYVVLASAEGYDARGTASWYGPTFQGERTSSGERYDMYAMTAAHKTLPLPCYARVTNLGNGRSVIVRVNDRGPFVGDRLIDLSYTAALKLDMIRTGTALVEVQAINPAAPFAPAPAPLAPAQPPTAPPLTASAATATGIPAAAPTVAVTSAAATTVATATAAAASVPATPVTATAAMATAAPARPLFIQVGAYASDDNARRAAHQLRAAGLAGVFTLLPARGQSLLRVRIGPIADLQQFDILIARLVNLGFSDAGIAQE